ncbi:two-component regulator propeller domain-containing protein [Mangrovibacterium sp.]|uniref:two-component regulator propeller domain-containing protein n=1 Tax=Mangrovibacterium sp. TaxID=1961364 RepID=UPI003566F9F8
MKLKQNLFLAFLLLALFWTRDGLAVDIRFRQVSPPGGFTLKSINCITQDGLGYIWMGTRQGLIRYDSKNTTWFIPSATDTISLPHEVVNCVIADSNNKLWVCTSNGLCWFNRQQQNFVTLSYTYEDGSVSSKAIFSVIDDNNKLLVLDNNYIGYLNEEGNKLHRVGANTIVQPSSIFKDNANRIWVGTEAGEVYRLSPDRKNVVKILDAKGSPVNSLYADNRQLWVGFEAHGAQLFTTNGEFIKQYVFPETPNQKTKDIRVRVILKDTNGRLWVGAYEGLFLDDGSEMIRFNKEKNPGLPHTSIFDIYEDNQGGLWIGTWSGGVALVHHSDNTFNTYRHEAHRNSISNDIVSSFLQVDDNELLIGTEVGGLNTFNIRTEQFDVVEISRSTNVENIKSMCKDKFGGVWIGTYKQGLWYRPAGTQTFQHFGAGQLASPDVYALCPVDTGVWIGTFGKGVCFYSFKNKRIDNPLGHLKTEPDLSAIAVNCLYVDSKSNLWVGGMIDLVRVHLPTATVENFRDHQLIREQSSHTIYSFWENAVGEIWIGIKNEAVLKYHPINNTFEKMDANGLLAGKDVYGFLEDEKKNIWITSNNGLVVYNPQNESYRHFLYTDGIQSNLFTPQAIFKDKNNQLYFGGTNGFTRLNPEAVKTNTKAPETNIHQLLTHSNRAVFPFYTSDRSIEEIELSPEENTFRITFSADNYLMPEKNRYRYRLRNYFDEWIDNQDGSVLFTSIDPGEYIFEVVACNNDGIWNDSPSQLSIVIHQIWYRTHLALLVYGLFFVSVIYFIYRFYAEQLKLKRAVQLEKSQRENEEQIHEMKLKFFTNISHEFRTPLTLISWPLKRLLQAENLTGDQRDELEVVHRNSNRLLQLINQLIDLRKLDKGKSKLNLSRFDLIGFTREMHKGFLTEDKQREIKFELDSEFDMLEIDADRDKLDIVLYNLISNAYKYSQGKGHIRVRIGNRDLANTGRYVNQFSFGKLETDDFVVIAVEDSGHGIESESLLNVFNRFQQGKSALNGQAAVNSSGIGLSICKEYTLLHNGVIKVQSDLGKGSCFTIMLPRKQKAQAILFESHQEIKNLKSTDILPVKNKAQQAPDQLNSILVVEDNADFSSFLRSYLSNYYQVEVAKDGVEALDLLKKRNIDLVVSDVMMPRMDGFEFCRILKAQVETCHIPVVLLTALSSSENLIAGLDQGADAYLTKPFEDYVLLKQIENILTQRRRIRQNFSKQFLSETNLEISSLDNFFLNRVRTIVESNIEDENFDVETLASELMISRSQLHRKIKSLSGTTTTDFVNLIRIKKAVEFIENENQQYNEVAFRVGFNSPSYFNKCFKKVYGITPKEYCQAKKIEPKG